MEGDQRECSWISQEVVVVVQSRVDSSFNWFVVVDIERSFEKYLGVKIGGFGDRQNEKEKCGYVF